MTNSSRWKIAQGLNKKKVSGKYALKLNIKHISSSNNTM